MKNLPLLLVSLFAISVNPVQAAEVYKCRVDGRMVYTDQPCDGEKVSLPSINGSTGESTYYSSTQWFYNMKGYQQALRLSERHDAPLFIFFEANWCGYCRKLEKELLHKASAKNALKPFVSVQISPEDGAEENRFFHGLGGKGYPSIFIQKTATDKPKKVYLQTKQNGRWRTLSTSEFQDLLSSFLL